MTEKEEQLYKDRLKKLEGLRKAGIDPYPPKTKRTHEISEAVGNFASLSKSGRELSLAGRIRGLRGHGAIVFGNLEDGSGSIQFLLREDQVAPKQFELFKKYLDIGDFISATGQLIKTKRGERTLEVKDFDVLGKSLRALPEQWHGLQDIETRLRQRYLDLIANPESKEIFLKKAKFWKAIREYLEKAGFIEVDTPALEDVPGGADAAPFVTHHHALDRDFYLRISLELPLKKIIVGGFEKVYEIGKVFRNEGVSTEHLQDFLECEFYWAYAEYEELMDFVEKLYKAVVKATTGGLSTEFHGQKINWGKKWPRQDYFELIEKELDIDLEKMSDEKLKKYAAEHGLEIDPAWGRGRIIDYLFKKRIRPKLIQPMFLINHPIEVSPLAKKHRKFPDRVERFNVIAAGTELGNGFSELNDPIDQQIRFQEQMDLRKAGDEEAQMMDESFVEALEYGMPPTAGLGFSERLFAVLMDKSIRETVIFPPMRDEQ